VGKKSRTAAAMQAIRAILIADWDPIGLGGPPDEYDHYIAGIYRLLESGADVVKLAGHLGKLERISMGLRERPEHNRGVAERLNELSKKFFSSTPRICVMKRGEA
jgi:hypothetical protein